MILIYTFINYYHKDRTGTGINICQCHISAEQESAGISPEIKREEKKNVNGVQVQYVSQKILFERDTAFKLLNWISYKYGFGTYLHGLKGIIQKTPTNRPMKN